MGLARIMSPDSPATTAARVANLEKRMAAIERKLDMLTTGDVMRTLGDSAPYAWGNSAGEPYYKKTQYQDDEFAPWVSHSSRLVANLTSSSTVRRTFGETLLLSGSLTGLSGALVWLAHWPVVIVPAVALCSFALSASALVLANRAELHRLVSAQGRGKRRQELKVEVSQSRGQGIEFLYLRSNITESQLQEFAERARQGASLAVHKWVGQGSLFTRGQYDDLMTELELMNYVTGARGPVARSLTAKGKALMRGLAEKESV